MLRTFFFLLVLANLLFFVWAQGYFGVAPDGREPQRLTKQLLPEKLRVIGSGAPPAGAAQACRVVSGVVLGELQRLVVQAREKQPELRFDLKPNDTPKSSYRVLIPSLGSKPAAERKAAELKKLDIPDFTVVLEAGADQFSILLGSFKSELAATEYLRELAKQGVRSAKVQVRESLLDKAQLEIRGPADRLATQVDELLQGQTAAKIGDCSAGNP